MLQAALDAYNNQITPLTEIPKKLQEYPNPVEEKVRLAVFQQLIQETQSTLEGPPQPIRQGPVSKSLGWETTPEVSSSGEPRKHWQESILRERIRDSETSIDGPLKPKQLEFVLKRTDLETIPEVSSTLEQEESICEPYVLEQIVPYTKIQQPNQLEPIIEEPSI